MASTGLPWSHRVIHRDAASRLAAAAHCPRWTGACGTMGFTPPQGPVYGTDTRSRWQWCSAMGLCGSTKGRSCQGLLRSACGPGGNVLRLRGAYAPGRAALQDSPRLDKVLALLLIGPTGLRVAYRSIIGLRATRRAWERRPRTPVVCGPAIHAGERSHSGGASFRSR